MTIVNRNLIYATLASLLCAICVSSIAGAQGFKRIAPDESLRNNKTLVSRILRDGTLTPAQQGQLDTYYKRYAIARWTMPNMAEQLPGFRNEMVQELRSGKGAARDYLAKLVRETMQAIASDEAYMPATRYNAMLMIGSLNAKEALGTQDKEQPDPQSLAILYSTYTDANQPDFLKVAAMLGLIRHTFLGIADNNVSGQVLALFGNVAKQAWDPDQSTQTEAVHDWFRQLAVRGLGASHDPKVVGVLVTIMRDTSQPIEIRNEAARALGQIDYANLKNVKPEDMAGALNDFAASVIETELEYLDELALKSQIGSGTGGMGGYDEGYGSGGLEDYGSGGYDEYGGGMSGQGSQLVTNSKRRVMAGLGAIQTAAKGGSGGYSKGVTGFAESSPEAKKQIDTLVSTINNLAKYFDDGGPRVTEAMMRQQYDTAMSVFRGETIE